MTTDILKDFQESFMILFVIEPFEENRLNFIKNKLKKSLYPFKLENHIMEFKKVGKLYFKYPFIMYRLEITENIYEDLVEEHGINLEKFDLFEWEQIQESEVWKNCELQVAREIIALKICKEFKIFS